MTIIVERAVAKVNLMLHVTGKMADGYHAMQSIFTFAENLYDTLIFDTSYSFSGQFIHKNDIIHDAYKMLRDEFVGIDVPELTKLKKRIPIGGGLGGGSSDAATFVNFVLDRNNIGNTQKVKFAQKLHKIGMDVPVFMYRYMHNKPKYIMLSGIGKYNELSSLDYKKNFFTLIVFKKKLHLSTSEVFKHYNGTFAKKENNVDILNSQNSLTEAAVRLCQEIGSILKDIKKTKPLIARMSGSGSSCFGIYENQQSVTDAMKELSSKGYSVF